MDWINGNAGFDHSIDHNNRQQGVDENLARLMSDYNYKMNGMAGSNILTQLTMFLVGAVSQIALVTCLKYELTLHTESASWNTAVRVCEANGGTLAQILTREKSDAIQYFKQNDWNRELEGAYWVGLFDDDVPNMRYTWHDCTLLEGHYRNWYAGEDNRWVEPNEPEAQMCVRNRKNEGDWRTKECSSEYQFICEKAIGDCTYSSIHGRTFPATVDSLPLSETYNSLEHCQAKCSGEDNPDTPCWGVTYGDVTKTCTIHRAPGPFALTQSDAVPLGDHTASIRICYKATVDGSNVDSSLVDNRNTPSVSCQSVRRSATTQLTTGAEVQPTTSETDDTGQSSVRHYTTESTTEYSGTEDMPPSGIPPEQSTSVVPSPSTDDITSSRMFEDCTGTACTLTSQQDMSTQSGSSSASEAGSVSETTSTADAVNASETSPASDGPEAVETASVGQVSSLPAPLCTCPCSRALSREESQVVISSILEQLTIQKTKVSAYKRKYISAQDDRPSAQGIGCSGAVILGVVFGGLIALDIPTLYAEMKRMIRNIRG